MAYKIIFPIILGLMIIVVLVLKEGAESKPVTPTNNYFTDFLCFHAITNSTIQIKNNSDRKSDPNIHYSINNKKWIPYTIGNGINIKKGDKIFFKGNNPDGFSLNSNEYSYFSISGEVAVSGNVASLLDSSGLVIKIPSNSCFYKLFCNCSSISEAHNLSIPFEYLRDSCFAYMFSGSFINKAPQLPALTLTPNCYSYMFANCPYLENTPKLNAVTLAEECYEYMFYSCAKLSEVYQLPAKKLYKKCYYGMFKDCETLEYPPDILAEEIGEQSVVSMFSKCKLKREPKLMLPQEQSNNYIKQMKQEY